MRELAPGVWQLSGWPPNMVNVYLLGDVLIDAGVRQDAGRILRQLRGRTIAAHALTHAHPDHLGSSHAVCETLGIPFWVGERDADAAQDTDALKRSLYHGNLPIDPLLRLFVKSQVATGHPVARRLTEGDEVAGFTVLDVPGHSPGHIAFWREQDRVLVGGDVVWNFQFVAGRPGLTTPIGAANTDSALNRASARRLGALQPALVCFGHGPPLRDTAKFVQFVEGLPT
jgi:glyoxylase-like metal-dependent hydrolase (beta-lactamase superfamily II)